MSSSHESVESNYTKVKKVNIVYLITRRIFMGVKEKSCDEWIENKKDEMMNFR